MNYELRFTNERTRAERQRRFFKARAIKFNRKLSRMGEKILEPKTFSRTMIEGQTLLIFTAIAVGLDKIINRRRK